MKQSAPVWPVAWLLYSGTLFAQPVQESASEAPPEARLLDRVVAVVGDRVITSSDVALEEILFERDPPRVALLRVGGRDALDRLIEAALIRQAAGEVAIYQPSAAEVRERLATLRSTWEDPAAYVLFLSTWGLDEGSLAGMLFTRMVVERYAHRNIGLAAESDGLSADEARARLDAWLAARRAEVTVRKIGLREGTP